MLKSTIRNTKHKGRLARGKQKQNIPEDHQKHGKLSLHLLNKNLSHFSTFFLKNFGGHKSFFVSSKIFKKKNKCTKKWEVCYFLSRKLLFIIISKIFSESSWTAIVNGFSFSARQPFQGLKKHTAERMVDEAIRRINDLKGNKILSPILGKRKIFVFSKTVPSALLMEVGMSSEQQKSQWMTKGHNQWTMNDKRYDLVL